MKPCKLNVGRYDHEPAIEVEFDDGRAFMILLDPAHATAIAKRLAECVDGSIQRRPPSRRVLEVTVDGFEAWTEKGVGT